MINGGVLLGLGLLTVCELEAMAYLGKIDHDLNATSLESWEL